MPELADPASDAPEHRRPSSHRLTSDVGSYAEALQVWRTPADVNAWMGARFEYSMARAMLLSETQRSRQGTLPIPPPTRSSQPRAGSASTWLASPSTPCAASTRGRSRRS
jgi:hypothetical protein